MARAGSEPATVRFTGGADGTRKYGRAKSIVAERVSPTSRFGRRASCSEKLTSTVEHVF